MVLDVLNCYVHLAQLVDGRLLLDTQAGDIDESLIEPIREHHTDLTQQSGQEERHLPAAHGARRAVQIGCAALGDTRFEDAHDIRLVPGSFVVAKWWGITELKIEYRRPRHQRARERPMGSGVPARVPSQLMSPAEPEPVARRTSPPDGSPMVSVQSIGDPS